MALDPQLQSKVSSWLKNQGFPFELRTARSLAASGFLIEHSRLYRDPRTGKAREIDLLATCGSHGAGGRPRVDIDLAIECKSQRSKPWVLFASETSVQARFLADIVTPGAIGAAAIARYRLETHLKTPLSSIDAGLTIGHGIVRANLGAKSRGPNVAYSAVRSAASAAFALAREQDQWLLEQAITSQAILVVLPIVVLEGALLQLSIDDGGNEKLDEVPWGKVLCPHPTNPTRPLAVTVVTAPSLGEFAALVERDSQELEWRLGKLISEISAAAKEDYARANQL